MDILCEIPGKIGVRIRKNGEETIFLYASCCGFQRGDLVSPLRLGMVSTWWYSSC